MHFNASPWMFEKRVPYIIQNEEYGLYLFHAYDPFIETIFIKKMKKYYKQINSSLDDLRIAIGNEITIDWIEDNLLHVGLFGNNDSYLILHAEKIPSDSFIKLMAEEAMLEKRYVIFSFSEKNDFFRSASKNKNINTLSINTPKFWEAQQLFDFLCFNLGIKLNYCLKNFCLNNIETNTQEFIKALIKIRAEGDLGDDISKLQKIIVSNKIDIFCMALMYSKKNKLDFYTELLKIDTTFEVWRSFFVFMQNYLLKLTDTSKIQNKLSKGEKVSNYHKEQLMCSKLWSVEQVSTSIRKFATWEILAKEKNARLFVEIRLNYLKVIKPKSTS